MSCDLPGTILLISIFQRRNLRLRGASHLPSTHKWQSKDWNQFCMSFFAILSPWLILICLDGLSNYTSASYHPVPVSQNSCMRCWYGLTRTCGLQTSHRCPWKFRVQHEPFVPGWSHLEVMEKPP